MKIDSRCLLVSKVLLFGSFIVRKSLFRYFCFSMLGMGFLLVSSSVLQAQVNWTGTTGDWMTGSNWSSGSVPSSGDTVDISNGGTAQVSVFVNPFYDSVDVAASSGTTGTLELLEGANLGGNLIRIGMQGTGTANVTGGVLQAGGSSLYVGSRHSDSPPGISAVGVLNLYAGGSAISDDDFQLGSQGTGTANFNTGSFGTGYYTVVAKYGTATWNHLGGVYAQSGGDFEIGDGGKPGDVGKQGPRMGTMNITGGAIQVANRFAISNRIGTGVVNISGGGLAITGDGDSVGDSRSNYLNIGRGADWSPADVAANNISGNYATFRVTGDDAVIAVGLDLTMDLNNVLESSTLVAEITGPSHTPILIGRNARIQNGNFSVELGDYSPVAGDQWSILQTNVDLTAALEAFDAIVAGEDASFYDSIGEESDAATMIVHNNNAFEENANDSSYVGVEGPFKSVNFSAAPLSPGLSFELEYLSDEIVLKVVEGLSADFNTDGDVDGDDLAIWETNYGANGTADTDGDGDSDGADFLAWQRQYGTSPGGASASTSAVPEPATFSLLALAALSLTAVRRRK